MGDWKFHQACLLFPPLSGPELQALAEDIRQRGLIHPIVTHEGMILDGRNRLLACEIAGVEPHFKEWTGTGSALEWAIATNLHRRHLTASQRAVLGLEMLPLFEEEAKERQRLSTGRGEKVAKQLPTFSKKGKSSYFAAVLAQSNSAYIQQVKSIRKKAPALVEQVKLGHLTVTEASRLSKLDTFQREKFFALKADQPNQKFTRLVSQVLQEKVPSIAATSQASPTNRIEILCGDFSEEDGGEGSIPDESVDIICTSLSAKLAIEMAENDYESVLDFDPNAWCRETFTNLNRVLKPEGSFFLIARHSPQHPWAAIDIAKTASNHFTIQNQIVLVKSVSLAGTFQEGVADINRRTYLNRNWAFAFHFTKKGTVNLNRKALSASSFAPHHSVTNGINVRCDGDVWFIPFDGTQGDVQASIYSTTLQSEVVERCIKLAGCTTDSVYLDPFCGINGLIAACRLGLHAFGIDSDRERCELAARQTGGAVYSL